MKLFPREVDFFDIFEKAAVNITKATTLLVSIMENFDDVEAKAKELYELEQDGDMLTHDIMKKLNKTFITPIDREDIHALASKMDDILDLIWAGIDRMIVFKITAPTREALEISKDLHRSAEVLQKTIKELKAKNYSHVQEHCIEINRLENSVDRIFRDATGDDAQRRDRGVGGHEPRSPVWPTGDFWIGRHLC